jgi:hypothetical protein
MNMKQKVAGTVVTVLLAVAATVASLFFWDRHAPEEGYHEALTTGSTVEIVINAGIETKQTPLVGFVHGITYDESKDYTRTLELLGSLKPKFWRLAGYNNVYEFVVEKGMFPGTSSTSITVNFQGLFNQKYGFPIGVAPCSSDVSGCFETYKELEDAWTDLLHEFMKHAVADEITMDYFDVFAEPNWGWEGVSNEQKLELFRIAHDVARSYIPDIRIIGIDLGGIESNPGSFLGVYVPFLDYVVKNGLRVDVVSWHEFRHPEEVVPRTEEMRRLISERPTLCDPRCPEIHVNEYAGPESHLIPGVNVGWLYYLEKAGVDQANRACWDDLGRIFKKWSSCWAGFNDMFLEDNVMPQLTYWIYKTYADMGETRLRSESSETRTVALASRDDSKEEISILIGAYEKVNPRTVDVTIKDYPYGNGPATVLIHKIPNYGNVVRAMPELPEAKVRTLSVDGGSVTVEIENFKQGEAYYVTIRSDH